MATDPSVTGRMLLRRLLGEHAGLLRQVNHLRATTPEIHYDDLTGLGTRRYFEMRVGEELSRVRRNPSCAGSMLLMDVDNLAAIREQHGPGVGDRAVRWVAKVLKESLRVSDIVCRGDDQFLVILCDTGARGAAEVVVRLRGQMTRARGYRWCPSSLSVGTAAWPEDASTLAALMSVAAARLHEDQQRRHESERPQLVLLP